jgi:hypothetical protein
MTGTEQLLLDTLLELEKAVKSIPSASTKPDLLPLFERIDALAEELPHETDPTFRHYLQKRSYEKAKLWLQDRDPENTRGNCRHT